MQILFKSSNKPFYEHPNYVYRYEEKLNGIENVVWFFLVNQKNHLETTKALIVTHL